MALDYDQIREFCADYSGEAFLKVVEIMRNDKAAIKEQLAAATLVLAYGWGKPINMPITIKPIAGLDLRTEVAAIQSLKTLTLEMAAGHLSIEHGRELAVMIKEVIAAERAQMEGQVSAALKSVQLALEGRDKLEKQNEREEAMKERTINA